MIEQNSIWFWLLAAAITGAILFSLEKVFLKNSTHKKVRRLVFAGLIGGLSVVALRGILPESDQSIKAEIEDIIANTEAREAFPTFSMMKESDPTGYASMLSEVGTLIKGSKGSFKDKKASAVLGVIFKQLGNYLRKASDQEILAYQEANLELLKELSSIDPFLACKFAHPEVFGTLTLLDIQKAKKAARLNNSLAALIRSGAKNGLLTESNAGSYFLGQLDNSFQIKYPQEARFIADPRLATDREGQLLLTKAIILYNEKTIALPAVERVAIFRYSFTPAR